MNKNIINKYKFILFTPLLLYFGERSLIAYDEGFYVLQARWILEKGNWIAPLWFNEVSLDRTIGVQFLIAISQKIFGTNKHYGQGFSGLIVVSFFMSINVKNLLKAWNSQSCMRYDT